LAEAILEQLPDNPSEKVEIPVFVYFTVYEVLQEANDKRAIEMLEIACQLLQERLSALETEEQRQFFLKGMPLHKEIMEAYQSQ
jgi:hypothetical protein